MVANVATVRAAVELWIDRLGAGLFGVACSGGADSIALADATIAVAGARNVVVVTVDHGLRSDSAKVAERVAAWAHEQGAGAVVRRVEVVRRASIEAAAREARYTALESAVVELGAIAMFLGHTARDQAETVLMRIVRGTGPAGLAAIPERRGPFVRPLLGLPRASIDAYVAERRLRTWDDPMNADGALTRTRIRNHVLPVLRRENPAIDDALVRLADSAREWLEVIDTVAGPLGRLPIDCPALAALPAAIRKRALTLALDRAGISYDATHLDQLDALIAAPARGEVAIDLPGGWRFVRSYDSGELNVPGVTQPESPRSDSGFTIRIWQAGDRMRPERLRGRSRKLSDLYIDAKIPREVRRRAWVVVRVADGVIVWAEHVGLAFGESAEIVPVPIRTGGTF